MVLTAVLSDQMCDDFVTACTRAQGFHQVPSLRGFSETFKGKKCQFFAPDEISSLRVLQTCSRCHYDVYGPLATCKTTLVSSEVDMVINSTSDRPRGGAGLVKSETWAKWFLMIFVVFNLWHLRFYQSRPPSRTIPGRISHHIDFSWHQSDSVRCQWSVNIVGTPWACV